MDSLQLSTDAASKLLTAITDSPILDVQHISNTNDVFKVVTERDGNFYVKFHTSQWYKEAADTYLVVQREKAVSEMLKRKGIPLNYDTWVDCSRSIVSRSVLISSELPGIPVPTALVESQGERDQILAALAHFLRQLHELTFATAGYIEFCGDADMPLALDPRECYWWDTHACQKEANYQKLASGILEAKKALLSPNLCASFEAMIEAIPVSVGPGYSPPRLVINNYHPFHIHVVRGPSGWRAAGLYDFEAASSGNPIFDLVGNELQLAPVIGNLAWRDHFYSVYGQRPALEAFKTVLLCFLLLDLGGKPVAAIPNPDWLMARLPDLIEAETYDAFDWYPANRP